MFALALTVLLQTRFVAPDAALVTAAAASARPRECRRATRGGLWSRLRVGDVERYCELLARAYARLDETPSEALSAAHAAESVAGPLPSVRLVVGRAELRLGQPALAFAHLAAVEAEDAQAFIEPRALHDYARAASLAGKSADAVRLYRLLVSRSALQDDAREAVFTQIEAAAHVLSHAPAGSDEALGYLAQVRHASLGLAPWVEALRRIALRRGGPGPAELRAVTPAPGAPARPVLDQLLLPAGMLERMTAVMNEPALFRLNKR